MFDFLKSFGVDASEHQQILSWLTAIEVSTASVLDVKHRIENYWKENWKSLSSNYTDVDEQATRIPWFNEEFRRLLVCNRKAQGTGVLQVQQFLTQEFQCDESLGTFPGKLAEWCEQCSEKEAQSMEDHLKNILETEWSGTPSFLSQKKNAIKKEWAGKHVHLMMQNFITSISNNQQRSTSTELPAEGLATFSMFYSPVRRPRIEETSRGDPDASTGC